MLLYFHITTCIGSIRLVARTNVSASMTVMYTNALLLTLPSIAQAKTTRTLVN